ncbi:MAG: class A beta-lactamase-related serine hydrolase [bacterium]|nr:class A beta-lactamase-related serine hydrolase [bacterium]
MNKKRKIEITMFLVGSIVAILIAISLVYYLRAGSPLESPPDETFSTGLSDVPLEPVDSAEPAVSNINAQAIKEAVEEWSKTVTGAYAITILDRNGQVIVNSSGDKTFFAASLYKLFTAYAGYQRVDEGVFSLNDTVVGGKSRKQCLDEMIKNSDSPCAEALRAEIGSDLIDKEIRNLGITNTSVTDLTTTSHDNAKMLKLIWEGEGLSDASRRLFLDSLSKQIYDDALRAGFESSKVYDKVGFRNYDEYHDVAIVELSNKEVIYVSVLTNKVGTTSIARLASSIEQAAL